MKKELASVNTIHIFIQTMHAVKIKFSEYNL